MADSMEFDGAVAPPVLLLLAVGAALLVYYCGAARSSGPNPYHVVSNTASSPSAYAQVWLAC